MSDLSRRAFVSLAAGVPALLAGVNETWNRTRGPRLAEAYARAAAEPRMPAGAGPATSHQP
jgi:hypothetical protein